MSDGKVMNDASKIGKRYVSWVYGFPVWSPMQTYKKLSHFSSCRAFRGIELGNRKNQVMWVIRADRITSSLKFFWGFQLTLTLSFPYCARMKNYHNYKDSEHQVFSFGYTELEKNTSWRWEVPWSNRAMTVCWRRTPADKIRIWKGGEFSSGWVRVFSRDEDEELWKNFLVEITLFL